MSLAAKGRHMWEKDGPEKPNNGVYCPFFAAVFTPSAVSILASM